MSITRLIKEIMHPDARTRANAVGNSASSHDTDVVSALMEALHDPDEMMRYHAAFDLGKMGAKSAVPALTKAVKDSNSDVRAGAAWALVKIGDSSAVPALMEAYQEGDNGSHLLRALGKLGGVRAVPLLIKSLREGNGDTRYASADALSEIGTPAIPAVQNLLNDSDVFVRYYAAIMLGNMGEYSVIPILLRAIRYSDPRLQSDACRALGTLGDVSVIPALFATMSDCIAFNGDCISLILKRIGDRKTLPLKVLSCETMTPELKRDTLELLGRFLHKYHIPPGARDYRHRSNVDYRLPPIKTYCKAVLKSRDVELAVKQGAQDVLDVLGKQNESHLLLRASSLMPDKELLRPTAGSLTSDPPDKLLRASELPLEPQKAKSTKRGFWQKWWRNPQK